MNKEVKEKFLAFARIYNLATSATTRNENHNQESFYSNDFLIMDHNANYGGYVIKIVHTTTGQSFLIGDARKSKAEMCNFLDGMIAVKMEYVQEKFKKLNNA